MKVHRIKRASGSFLLLTFLALYPPARAQENEKKISKDEAAGLPALIWRDPGNIPGLNLIYGAGGADHAPDPNGNYTFLEEDKAGTSAKFNVRDANGVEWRVKLGAEPQSETAATRLLWAAGYFVDEDYYLPEFKVTGMQRLRRGQKFVTQGGIVHRARLERKDKKIKKLGNWDWYQNRFTGTKEINGLRVMMALLNNWDLKDINNSIYVVDGEQHYAVTDAGSTFGKTGSNISRSKSNEKDYEKSKFIKKVTPEEVDLEMHSRPFVLTAINIGNYRRRTKMEKITKHIPRAHAKFIGELLGQLSTEQLRDCFRSAGYTQAEIEGYVNTVVKRIAALNAL
jgi:hypothetical protein